MKLDTPSRLSDSELTATLLALARAERAATLLLIVHLAEFDARRLYLGAAFSSMFTYFRSVLRLSEHEAYHRIRAARTARRFPVILGMLDEGSLNLTTVRLLSPHLTDANKEELLAAAAGKGRRDMEALLARRFPQP